MCEQVCDMKGVMTMLSVRRAPITPQSRFGEGNAKLMKVSNQRSHIKKSTKKQNRKLLNGYRSGSN